MVLVCGINGAGRIGRQVLRAWLKNPEATGIDFVAINDPFTDIENFAYLFKFDSVHGKFTGTISTDPENNTVTLNGRTINFYFERNPADIPWTANGVHTVLESSGAFLTRERAGAHLKAGAKRVMLSAPAKGPGIPHFVLGVNHQTFEDNMDIISNASCTTNCLAPMCKVLDDTFGIESGLLNTIHAFTSTQANIDRGNTKKPRLGRACANNIIPSSTGAAKAVGKVIPHLNGKLDGMSTRVPVPDVSMVDLTVILKRDTDLETVIAAFKKASTSPGLKGILDWTDEPVVSSDFVSDPRSCVIDVTACMALSSQKNFFKIVAWYDNEVIYATRCVDFLSYIAKSTGSATSSS